ncbi:hypothetical protein CH267_06390 [Rhodococcus sp. 06-621-2]|nr:fumarylacetoacetate hydrolase family protein [Rhodococcus sp. 06-621-2]OZC59726.1 hypothetical protein CH267_06390 [Rhodococcus sp. 06-621-2]
MVGSALRHSRSGAKGQLYFELVLGFFVARGGRNIIVADASSYIAGITILNDLSAWDMQAFEMSALVGPAKGKNFANVIGPAVSIYDEVDLDSIRVTASVNGELWAEGSAAEQSYSFEETLDWASYGEYVVPGEFIATQTVGGGCGLEQTAGSSPAISSNSPTPGSAPKNSNRVGDRESVPDTAGLPRFEHFPVIF